MINMTWQVLSPKNIYFGRHLVCPKDEFNLPHIYDPTMVTATMPKSNNKSACL